MSTALDVLRYVVRASGLFIMGGVALILVAAPLIGTNRGVLAPLGGLWLLASVVLSWPRLPDAWRRDPPTQRQLEYAEALGIAIPEGVSKGELSDLISQATGR